jgi:hypothetical protein
MLAGNGGLGGGFLSPKSLSGELAGLENPCEEFVLPVSQKMPVGKS